MEPISHSNTDDAWSVDSPDYAQSISYALIDDHQVGQLGHYTSIRPPLVRPTRPPPVLEDHADCVEIYNRPAPLLSITSIH